MRKSRIKRKFRTVVTSSAGYPLDKTYYQTVKGMVGALEIPSPEGRSSPSRNAPRGSVRRVRRSAAQPDPLGPEKFLQEILPRRYAAIDEWQAEMQVKAMKKGSVCLFSDGLSKEQQSLTGVSMIASPAAAVMESVNASGDRRVAVIPEGPYVIPLFVPDHE